MRQIVNGLSCQIAVILLLAATAVAAEGPEIVVEAGASEIFIGESVEYIVEIRNVKNPTPPDVEALREDFDVESRGDESRNQSSIMSINGRVTRNDSFSHVFRYRLTPRRTGKLSIPAVSATIEGETILSRRLTLEVIAPEEQDLVIPEITTNRARVYPTQPFEVTLRVLVHPLPDSPDRDPLSLLRRSPPHLDVNWVDLPTGLTGDEKIGWLKGLLAENGSGFTLNEVTTRSSLIFEGPQAAVFNLFHGRERREGLDGRPVNYFVYELKRRIIPEKTGTYNLGPAVVKGTFVKGTDGTRYTGRRLVAMTTALVVEVREVPSPRPATFCGGIGEYRVAASASPTGLRVGDPLTLTLEIEREPGSGSLELISAPDLAISPQIASDFAILDKSPTGRSEGNVKRFAYALRPKRAGVEIPALTMTVFDPDAEKFSEIATKPIALTVSEGARMGAGELVGALNATGTQEIRSREQGIFQNVTDLSELQDQNVDVATLAGTAAGFWCAVGCMMGLVASHRRKSGDLVWQRKQQARGIADRKLANARAALAAERSTDSLSLIRSAVVGMIADMRNIVGEGLTAVEADSVLAQTDVPADIRSDVLHLLESIESAEYGSGTAAETPAIMTRAETLIPNLARHLARST